MPAQYATFLAAPDVRLPFIPRPRLPSYKSRRGATHVVTSIKPAARMQPSDSDSDTDKSDSQSPRAPGRRAFILQAGVAAVTAATAAGPSSRARGEAL